MNISFFIYEYNNEYGVLQTQTLTGKLFLLV